MAQATPSLDPRQAESRVRPRPTTSLVDPPATEIRWINHGISLGYIYDYVCIYIYSIISTNGIYI